MTHTTAPNKRHYYVPAFNLALFAERADRDALLSVMFVPSGERARLKPDGIGYEKHFHRVTGVEDVDPQFFEAALADLENRAAPAIKRIVREERMPTNTMPERTTVMNYLSLQAARTPFARERLAQIRDLIDHLYLRMEAASPERLRARLSEQREAEGGRPPDDDEIRSFVQMVRDRSFVLEREQGEHAQRDSDA